MGYNLSSSNIFYSVFLQSFWLQEKISGGSCLDSYLNHFGL